jgi:hypothetical protein
MCQFDISFTGDPESLTTRAKQAIEKLGGTFTGNVSQGQFRAKTAIGSIHGSYHLKGQQMSIVITKKPLLLSCGRIEKELNVAIR